jgi:hypothetical protein
MRIAIFARYPTPGEAKTRLIPALGPDGAAALHRKLVEHTLKTVRTSGLPHTLYFTGAPQAAFAAWLGPETPFIPQAPGDLGARLAAVPAPCILIGADCPDLTPAHLHQAAAALSQGRTALGPAEDGGYWLLALPTPNPKAFENIAWGTQTVAAQTLPTLENPVILETLADCDRPADLSRWPHLTT